jgi:hypothetical protein
MTLKNRVKKLEELEKRCTKTSRSPVHWAAIVEGKLIRVGLGNGTNLAGPESRRALEEAQKKRDPPLRFIGLIRTIFSLLSKPKQLFGAEFSNDDGDVLCRSNIA